MFKGVECPVCGKNRTELSFETMDIPHFGEVLESTMKCPDCKWRHVDVIILKSDKPMKHTLKIDGTDDLDIRVVRSSSGTIEVPEIGVKISPGTQGEGFITNVDGVFHRIQDILETPSLKKKKKTRDLNEKIEHILRGEVPATLIIEDPTGNSAIISDQAVKENTGYH